MLRNWMLLEGERVDIIRRMLSDVEEVAELPDSGDKVVIRWVLGDMIVILNITEMAKALDAAGVLSMAVAIATARDRLCLSNR